MGRQKLSDDEIRAQLAQLPEWRFDGGKLCRALKFGSFVEAFGWMTRVALVAEKMDHHPDWKNVYNRVTVELCTHDADGVTDRDFELARVMNRLAG